MRKDIENQASNQAFYCASFYHHGQKQEFESEKKFTLSSYSDTPEFAEKFNAVLAYYMIRENFVKDSNETR